MNNNQNSIINSAPSFPKGKGFDLEERTFEFAKKVRQFVRTTKMDLPNIEDAKQLVRSSGSVGANYIEANEPLSKKDFLFRIKVCRKEVKETRYWLNLIDTKSEILPEKLKEELIQEASELLKIFSTIITKTEISVNATASNER